MQQTASTFSERTSPFSAEEHGTWAAILEEHRKHRAAQLVPIFFEGLSRLELDRATIPTLEEVNTRLRALTGWEGVFVKGLEEGPGFYSLLANRKFPIGHFVRDRRDLNYTPAPDVVHDLYGHIPFHANRQYADYCEAYGKFACQFLDDSVRLRRLERYFWFTNEFALVETPQGRRIFGAGIASSVGECAYALSGTPMTVPFDVQTICDQEFRIDQMQPKLFVLQTIEQLYDSFGTLQKVVKA